MEHTLLRSLLLPSAVWKKQSIKHSSAILYYEHSIWMPIWSLESFIRWLFGFCSKADWRESRLERSSSLVSLCGRSNNLWLKFVNLTVLSLERLNVCKYCSSGSMLAVLSCNIRGTTILSSTEETEEHFWEETSDGMIPDDHKELSRAFVAKDFYLWPLLTAKTDHPRDTEAKEIH